MLMILLFGPSDNFVLYYIAVYQVLLYDALNISWL